MSSTAGAARALAALAVLAAFAMLVGFGLWQWGRYQEKLAAAAAGPAPMERLAGPFALEGVAKVWRPLAGVGDIRQIAIIRAGDGRFVLVGAGYFGAIFDAEAEAIAGRFLPQRAGWGVRRAVGADGVYTHSVPAWILADKGGPIAPDLFEPATIDLDGDGRWEPNPFLAPGDGLPPARHLGYAITWWGLAVGLLGVSFAARWRGRVKNR